MARRIGDGEVLQGWQWLQSVNEDDSIKRDRTGKPALYVIPAKGKTRSGTRADCSTSLSSCQ